MLCFLKYLVSRSHKVIPRTGSDPCSDAVRDLLIDKPWVVHLLHLAGPGQDEVGPVSCNSCVALVSWAYPELLDVVVAAIKHSDHLHVQFLQTADRESS